MLNKREAESVARALVALCAAEKLRSWGDHVRAEPSEQTARELLAQVLGDALGEDAGQVLQEAGRARPIWLRIAARLDAPGLELRAPMVPADPEPVPFRMCSAVHVRTGRVPDPLQMAAGFDWVYERTLDAPEAMLRGGVVAMDDEAGVIGIDFCFGGGA